MLANFSPFIGIICFVGLGSSELMHVPGAGEKPHIVMLLADDLGWNHVGWHHPDGYTQEVHTPNMNKLVQHGIELDRAYVACYCAPTRASLQSGRLPVHGNWDNHGNFGFTDSGEGSGMPVHMTGIAEHLKRGGYATHFVGKWGAGFANFKQLPVQRGYDSSFGFLLNSIDPWTHMFFDFQDGWKDYDPHPTSKHFTTAAYGLPAGVLGEEDQYYEFHTKSRALHIISTHDRSKPLFLCYCFRLVHDPLYLPLRAYLSVDFLHNEYFHYDSQTGGDVPVRRLYAAALKYMDEIIGEIHAKLDEHDMWSRTVLVFMSDNGGPAFQGSDWSSGSNHPLKGGKDSPFEGGIRSASFVSGGFLARNAPNRVGTKLSGYVHICDWYSTFAVLAGVDSTDYKARQHNMPEIDSLNMWPYLTGVDDFSPRHEIHISEGALIKDEFKIVENVEGYELDQGCWSGPIHPNSTFPDMDMGPGGDGQSCHRKESCKHDTCLYNIRDDEGEHHDLSQSHQGKLHELKHRLHKLKWGILEHKVGKQVGVWRDGTTMAWKVAQMYGGVWGPFLPLDGKGTKPPNFFRAFNASRSACSPLQSIMKQMIS